MARALLVDDSATARSLVKVYLMGLGVEFVDAADGEAGLLLLDGSFDFVVCDVNMPRMDGLTFLRRVRSSGEVYRDVPIVMLTGEAPEIRQRALDLGATAFVQKPVTSSDLRKVVVELLGARPPSEER